MSSPSRSFMTPSRPERVEVVSGEESPQFLDHFNSLIARRAYDLFEQCGRIDGADVTHWLQAENELVTLLPEVREANGAFTVNLPLPGFSANQVKIWANENRALISADNSSNAASGDTQQSALIYYMVRWPENVEPNSFDARLENGELRLTARKAQPSEANTGRAESEDRETLRTKLRREVS
jgi:HSP20 family molecular chaperone IbpA